MFAYAATVMVRVMEPPAESVALLLLNETFNTGSPLAVSNMVPLNPLRLVSVILDDLEVPTCTVRVPGLAVTVKSGEGAGETVTVLEDTWLCPPESITLRKTA